MNDVHGPSDALLQVFNYLLPWSYSFENLILAIPMIMTYGLQNRNQI